LVGGLLLLPLTYNLLLATFLGTVALILIRTWRAGSVADACFGQIVWQVTALAMVRGFCAKTRNPTEPIEYNVIARPQSK
jgi:hypothetical protein